jgi:hypothetical protein
MSGSNLGSNADLRLLVYLGENPEGGEVTVSPEDFVADLKDKILDK